MADANDESPGVVLRALLIRWCARLFVAFAPSIWTGASFSLTPKHYAFTLGNIRGSRLVVIGETLRHHEMLKSGTSRQAILW